MYIIITEKNSLMYEQKETFNDRVRTLVDTRYQGNWAEFGRDMGLNASTLQNIKSGGNISTNSAIVISNKLALSLDWLLAGVGPMYRPRSGRTLMIAADTPLEDVPKAQMILWLEAVWTELSPQQKIWMHEQFRRAFPEFGAWLAAGARESRSPLPPSSS